MTGEAFAALRRRLAAAFVDHGHAQRAALLDRLVPRPGDGASSLPVLVHLDDALARAAREVDEHLAAALRPLAHAARWQQTAAYVANPPDPTFLDGYAHATLAQAPDVACGLLLLGPGVRYPPHHHPAEEFYLPAAAIRWVHAVAGEFALEPAGVLVHHAPWQAHGMGTDARPALLVYVWTGDVRTSSAFC